MFQNRKDSFFYASSILQRINSFPEFSTFFRTATTSILTGALMLAGILSGCKSGERKIIPAYYHWKTIFNPTARAMKYLDTLQTEKLYVRVFDVDWDENLNTFAPKAIVKWEYEPPVKAGVCPSVFITNKTFEKIPDSLIQVMAEKVWKKIFILMDSTPELQVPEIMMDCDWSTQTREKYFSFLKFLKEKIPKSCRLNVTIRLHQVKYYKMTGVPPGDMGTLMFYNMTNIRDEKTRNSILDIETAKKYFVNFDQYPLPLNLILPVFSWGVVRRNGIVVDMLNDFRPDSAHFELSGSHELKVKESFYYNGTYLYQGDVIRQESPSYSDLMTSAELLSPLLQNPELTLGFYHLSEENREAFPAVKLISVMDLFR
ncbi:MAG: hypothetical protein K1X92_01765 [Bacteroidia bacterium]|nr:hypothetical protein [Bacteroidia bacterium]